MNASYHGEVTSYDENDLCHIMYVDGEFESGVNLGIELYRKVKPAGPVVPKTPVAASGMSSLMPEEDSSDDDEDCAMHAKVKIKGNKQHITMNKDHESDDDDDEDEEEGDYEFNEELPLLPPAYQTEDDLEEEGQGEEQEEGISLLRALTARKTPTRGPGHHEWPEPASARKNVFPPRNQPPALHPRAAMPYLGVVRDAGDRNYAEIRILVNDLPPPSLTISENHGLDHDTVAATAPEEESITVRSTFCNTELEAALAYDLLVFWQSAMTGHAAPNPESLNFYFVALEEQPGLVTGAQACNSHTEVKGYVDHLIISGILHRLVAQASEPRSDGGASGSGGSGSETGSGRGEPATPAVERDEGEEEEQHGTDLDEEYERERPRPRARVDQNQKRQRDEAHSGDRGDAKRHLSGMQAQRGMDADGWEPVVYEGGSSKEGKALGHAPVAPRRIKNPGALKSGYQGVILADRKSGKWRSMIHVVLNLEGRVVSVKRNNSGPKKGSGTRYAALSLPCISSKREASVYRDIGQLWKQEMTGFKYNREKINCPAVWDGGVAPKIMKALRAATTLPAARELFASCGMRTEVSRLAATMKKKKKKEEEEEEEVSSDVAAPSAAPAAAPSATPVPGPPPTLHEMQIELKKYLQHTPGVSLSKIDVIEFLAFFVCNVETRLYHLCMLRGLAEEGDLEGMKAYVETVVETLKKGRP